MLIGHYAPALVLQRVRPSVKLWQLFIAAQFVDVLWAAFVLGRVEHVRIIEGFTAANDLDLWFMPYSHSIAATVAWAAFALVVWRLASREPTRTGDAVVLAAAVASHFLADLLVHTHDLPVMSGDGTKLGLGLWDNLPVALAVETGLFAAASVYWWWPRRADPKGARAGVVLLVLTVLAAATYFTPTPPSAVQMTVSALATYAGMAALAGWIERTGGS